MGPSERAQDAGTFAAKASEALPTARALAARKVLLMLGPEVGEKIWGNRREVKAGD